MKILAVIVLAAQRIRHNLGLVAGTFFALVVAVALAMSIPLYVDGARERVLQRAMEERFQARPRPPYAFLFRYAATPGERLTAEAIENAELFFRERAPGLIGLPLETSVSFFRTPRGRLYPQGSAGFDERTAIAFLTFATASDIMDHIELVEGQLPVRSSGSGQPEVLDALMAEDKANEIGLQVGERFVWLAPRGDLPGNVQIPIRVSGIWHPRDPMDEYWYQDPNMLNGSLLIDPAAMAGQVQPAFGRNPVEQAIWYQIYDGGDVSAAAALRYLGRWDRAWTEAVTALPGVTLDVSPADALAAYAWTSRLLTIMLVVFTLPIYVIIVGFIVVNAALVVGRQSNEIAILRSRGTTAAQVAGLYFVEALLLSLLALAIGPWLGLLMARAMLLAESFLAFKANQVPTIGFSWQSLLFGVFGVAVGAIASVLPALGAARHTIVSYKRELARAIRRPWWQSLFLDLWLLAATLYGYYELQGRGAISLLGRTLVSAQEDPFTNPYLFLVPTLFVFALALVFLRFFPWIMRLLATFVSLIPSAGPVLAFRRLDRAWKYYIGPLLLIILTLGLACFTASMAETLDLAVADRAYYEVGADVRLAEMGEYGTAGGEQQAGSANGPVAVWQGGGQVTSFWTSLPVAEHTRVDGVTSAARAAIFPAYFGSGSGEAVGSILGIDRVEFGRTAYYRRDFGGAALGTLMNRLASEDGAVLVSPSVIDGTGLSVGSRLQLRVFNGDRGYEAPVVIVGTTDYFPLLFPDDGPFFIGNLDYLFEHLGGEQPYDVLLKIRTGANVPRIVEDLRQVGYDVVATHNAQARIATEQRRPERQGLLGLLSVGFLAAAVLSALGFLYYAFVSYRQRFIELGILRAIGLSMPQVVGLLSFELMSLIVTGVAAGTAAGVLASWLFIPFLQVQGGAHSGIPPFRVLIAWNDIFTIYLIFGALLLGVMAGLARLLVRLRVGEAVKLGETV